MRYECSQALHRWRESFDGQCGQRPHTRHGLKPARGSALPRQFRDLPGLFFDPGRLLADLSQKVSAFLLHNLGQADLSILDNRLNVLDVTNPLRNDLPIVVENGAQSVL
jgi:hypothetical protein